MGDLPIMKYFEYKHLPEHLQEVSIPFCVLARSIHDHMPIYDANEKIVALRKLLESKDAAVRAVIKPREG